MLHELNCRLALN